MLLMLLLCCYGCTSTAAGGAAAAVHAVVATAAFGAAGVIWTKRKTGTERGEGYNHNVIAALNFSNNIWRG